MASDPFPDGPHTITGDGPIPGPGRRQREVRADGGSERSDSALTFDESAAEAVIEAFGWEVSDNGLLYDPDRGAHVRSVTGVPVGIDEFAGVVEFDGAARALRDDFNELVEYARYRRRGQAPLAGGRDD